MSNYNVRKGFILVPDENNEYVPFFVQVREKDIIWDKHIIFSSRLSELKEKYKELIESGDFQERFESFLINQL